MSAIDKLHARSKDRLREIVRQPDWYMDFDGYKRGRLLGSAAIQAVRKGNIREGVIATKEALVASFEELLAEEVVALGSHREELEDWDKERRPVDTIVIHHTSRPPGLRKETLNAMHLLRLYVPRYQSKSTPVLNEDGNRQPIYSGHFNEQDRQIFYAYHWLVRSDGEAERLLKDGEIGWQAGNWPVNCRSIAICIDNDLTIGTPNEAVMNSIAEIIKQHYSNVTISPETLKGHGEVSNTETLCPGSDFISGWKLELLDKLL